MSDYRGKDRYGARRYGKDARDEAQGLGKARPATRQMCKPIQGLHLNVEEGL